MDDLKSRFLNEENFYIAFKKLSHYLRQSNEWYNPVELSSYEANLSTHIFKLIKTIEEGNYKPRKIELLPFPKKNKNDIERIRQYFRINIEDQLVWIALVNIIGSFLEDQMPFWSYGNRLFRRIWFTDLSGGKKSKNIGSCGSNSVNLYRKWNKSWPLYRRNISLTIKTMGYNIEFSESFIDNSNDKKLFEFENNIVNNKNDYINNKFWKEGQVKNLYWAGLDFKDFFPSINMDIIYANIEKYLVKENGEKRDDVELILKTLKILMHFDIDINGWVDYEELVNDEVIDIDINKPFNKIPTGLLVAGFLANVALIDIDKKITDYIEKNRDIAVFKYVDDQVIISKSKNSLQKFLNFYHNLIKTSKTGLLFQDDKIIPAESIEYNINSGFGFKSDPIIDVNNPTPLMTLTLEKMSQLNEDDLDLLDDDEINKMENDLTHFLLTDFPEEEMKKDTRVAFASMKLCNLSKKIVPDFSKIDTSLYSNFSIINSTYEKVIKNQDSLDAKLIFESIPDYISYNDKKIQSKILFEKIQSNFINDNLKVEIDKTKKKYLKIYSLLIKAAKNSPDKLKLWKRCVEFCYNSGLDKIPDIFLEISLIPMHAYGKLYIRHYCTFILNELILKCISKMANKDTPFWSSYLLFEFYNGFKENNIFEYGDIGYNFPLANETILNYQIIRQVTLKIGIENTEMHERTLNYGTLLSLFDSYKDINKGMHSFKFEDFLWFLLSEINGDLNYNIWKDNLKHVDFNHSISWSIISLYPGKIPKTVLETIVENTKDDRNKSKKFISQDINSIIIEKFDFINDAEGILYEVFENHKSNKELLIDFPVINQVLNSKVKDYYALNIWLNKMVEKTSKEKWIDPRISEWSLLEIIIQISGLIIKKQKEFNKKDLFEKNSHKLYYVHPANYLIPKEWLSYRKGATSWDNWKNTIKKNKIKLTHSRLFIHDFRYLPLSNMWKHTGALWFYGTKDIPIIIGLSVLMTQLLSKSLIWPIHVNKLTFIDNLMARFSNIISIIPISTETRVLLSGIFSKKKLEFFTSSNVLIINDNLKISNLEDFISELRRIQKLLEVNQISLMNNAPRQLTFINIDTINNLQ